MIWYGLWCKTVDKPLGITSSTPYNGCASKDICYTLDLDVKNVWLVDSKEKAESVIINDADLGPSDDYEYPVHKFCPSELEVFEVNITLTQETKQ